MFSENVRLRRASSGALSGSEVGGVYASPLISGVRWIAANGRQRGSDMRREWMWQRSAGGMGYGT